MELFWGQDAICTEAHAQAYTLHWGEGGGRETREGHGRPPPLRLELGRSQPTRTQASRAFLLRTQALGTLSVRSGGEQAFQAYGGLNLGF